MQFFSPNFKPCINLGSISCVISHLARQLCCRGYDVRVSSCCSLTAPIYPCAIFVCHKGGLFVTSMTTPASSCWTVAIATPGCTTNSPTGSGGGYSTTGASASHSPLSGKWVGKVGVPSQTDQCIRNWKCGHKNADTFIQPRFIHSPIHPRFTHSPIHPRFIHSPIHPRFIHSPSIHPRCIHFSMDIIATFHHLRFIN